MLDTLLTVAMLALPARPAMVRTPALVAPAQVASIYMTRNDEHASNELTTCYENKSGSCWSEE